MTVAEWPINMIGSWALVERTPRARVADTTVWILGAAGVLEHPEVQVGARGGALATRERAIATSRRWTQERVGDGRKVRVVCVCRQHGRNSECAPVTSDTVLGARGAPPRCLTWTGVTFRDQHWTFAERTRQ